jgi:hypothetical protein
MGQLQAAADHNDQRQKYGHKTIMLVRVLAEI